MSHYFKALAISSVIGMLATGAQAATVKEVFNGEMLGTNQRYFESIAGIPRQSYGDSHVFRVQGCDITATINNGAVASLSMELGGQCQANLGTFIGDYAPPAGQTLTPGAFEESSGGGLSYLADCLSLCGNAADPSVYALWEGPRAAGFMEVMLEVVLVDGDALDAASLWQDHMTKAAGEDFVMDTRFNCDRRFDAEAHQAFKDVKVTAVTIGHGLSTPRC